MADEVRTYRHREVDESGTNAVAIVAIVLVVLVAIVLMVVYWENIFGTATTETTNTIVTDDNVPTTTENTINIETTDPSLVIRDSSSGEIAPMPIEDTTTTTTTGTTTTA